MKKLLLIDGHSILHRTFYGLPDLTTSDGRHTNAVLGFLNILFRLLEEEQPTYLAVAFDVHAPTFRHKIYDAYKGTRKPMPPELREQIPLMKEILMQMGICTVEQEGLEADDILGTLAKRGEAQGLEVSLISGDRDLLQIASQHIQVRIPKTKSGRTEIENYYEADVVEKYGVTPHQFIELKALMGDTADNIPGVPKIGEKTAADLMQRFGSLENIYQNLSEISKKSIRESLEQNRDLADLSLILATIEVNGNIEKTFDDMEVMDYFTPTFHKLCQELEFKSILKKFSVAARQEEVSCFCRHITDLQQAESLWKDVEAAKSRFFYLVGEEDFLGFILAISSEEAIFVEKGGFLTEDYLTEHLRQIAVLKDTFTFDVKRAFPILGEKLPEIPEDLLLEAYLCNPNKSDYSIEDIAKEYGEILLPSYSEKFGKKDMKNLLEENSEEFATFWCNRAHALFCSRERLKKQLKEKGMTGLYHKMELPLTRVLFSMEKEGILVRPDELKRYGDTLQEKIASLEEGIYVQCGERFNLNSPKQLGEVLFEKMGIPGGKKTKSGYSTAADVLEKLKGDYPVVGDILEYRGLAKLKSTYADGLASYIGEDNRIHTSYHQTITATGRISSTDPNLQNIPMRMELGRLIRKVFVPEEGNVFVDADYSQIELRILAHMSGDQNLIEAYRSGEDIHRMTASQVFDTPFEEVTDLQRRNAKAVNFGIVYGISAFGLSQDLSISRKEAQEYIDHYFAVYPGIKAFLDKTVADAKQYGYSETLFGRIRPIPELSSSNFMQRSFGERVAMNAPIQGTAADIMKIAMIGVYNRLNEENMKTRIILQIHDELVLEAPEEEAQRAALLLQEEMEKAAELLVPLTVEVHTGKDWYEAK